MADLEHRIRAIWATQLALALAFSVGRHHSAIALLGWCALALIVGQPRPKIPRAVVLRSSRRPASIGSPTSLERPRIDTFAAWRRAAVLDNV
jgi:hypothetical protein